MAQLANVAQLTGVDVGGLVSMIVQAVGTVRRNKKECRELARRVGIVGDLLQRLHDPETMQDPVVRKPLSELEETLRHAYRENGVWKINLVRNFGREEEEQWKSLKESLNDVDLNEEQDKAVWSLEKSGQFSVKSQYSHVAYGGLPIGKCRSYGTTKSLSKLRFFFGKRIKIKFRLQTSLK